MSVPVRPISRCFHRTIAQSRLGLCFKTFFARNPSVSWRSKPRVSVPHLPSSSLGTQQRNLHTTPARCDRSFTNMLADDNPPAVQVASISDAGIVLMDGLTIPGPCIFLEGKVFLWDVPHPNLSARSPTDKWKGWSEERLQIFEVVTPKPEILLLGTGKSLVQPPPFIREALRKLGIQLDVMDTRNACSTYNILSEEGRRVAAALLPFTPHTWQKKTTPSGPSR